MRRGMTGGSGERSDLVPIWFRFGFAEWFYGLIMERDGKFDLR